MTSKKKKGKRSPLLNETGLSSPEIVEYFNRKARHLNAKEICALTGLAESTVSESQRLLRTPPQVDHISLEDQRYRKLDALLSSRTFEALVSYFQVKWKSEVSPAENKPGILIDKCLVTNSGGNDHSSHYIKSTRLLTFSRGMAFSLIHILRNSNVVGIAWGQTLNYLVNELVLSFRRPNKVSKFFRSKKPMIFFVPVCPVLPHPKGKSKDDSMASPETLAKKMNRHFNGYRPGQPPSIILGPYHREHTRHREVFENRDALVKRMDTLITTIGTADTLLQSHLTEIAEALDMRNTAEVKARLEQTNLIEIAGVFYSTTKSTSTDNDFVSKLNENYRGLKPKELEGIARRAYQQARPGITVIASGEQKADAIFEFIKKGLINTLIVDHVIAKKLSDRLYSLLPGDKQEV